MAKDVVIARTLRCVCSLEKGSFISWRSASVWWIWFGKMKLSLMVQVETTKYLIPVRDWEHSCMKPQLKWHGGQQAQLTGPRFIAPVLQMLTQGWCRESPENWPVNCKDNGKQYPERSVPALPWMVPFNQCPKFKSQIGMPQQGCTLSILRA